MQLPLRNQAVGVLAALCKLVVLHEAVPAAGLHLAARFAFEHGVALPEQTRVLT
jgi:hypothetical protein